jgi:uncharacterized protein
MTISMHQVLFSSVRSLQNLVTILEKGSAFCESKKMEPQLLLNARLYPDMFSLCRQVQVATDITRRGAARLAGLEAPAMEDNETNFEELIERVKKAIAYIETLTPDQIDGTEEKEITLPIGKDMTMKFAGSPYLLYFILPNLYFHVTTAYDILRHHGVEVGKMDFLGKP